MYELNGRAFELQKRRYWRNDFAPIFFGQFIPAGGGTRIQGEFNTAVWVRSFMWGWLAFAAVIGLPISFHFLVLWASQHRLPAADEWVGLLVPPSLLVWGFILPRLGRLFGKPEEAFLKHFLENTFSGELHRDDLAGASFSTSQRT